MRRVVSGPEIHADQMAVLKTLFMIVTVFIMIWTPKFVHTLLSMVGVRVPLLFSYIVYLLIFLQGMINPVIYYFRQSAFKEELRKMFRKYTTKGIHSVLGIHSSHDEVSKREQSSDTQSSVYSIRNSPLYLVFPDFNNEVTYPVTFNSVTYQAGIEWNATLKGKKKYESCISGTK